MSESEIKVFVLFRINFVLPIAIIPRHRCIHRLDYRWKEWNIVRDTDQPIADCPYRGKKVFLYGKGYKTSDQKTRRNQTLGERIVREGSAGYESYWWDRLIGYSPKAYIYTHRPAIPHPWPDWDTESIVHNRRIGNRRLLWGICTGRHCSYRSQRAWGNSPWQLPDCAWENWNRQALDTEGCNFRSWAKHAMQAF